MVHLLESVLSKEILVKVNSSPFPEFKSPMLATLTEDYFDDLDWIYERKLDGIRCLVYIKDGIAKLYSRNGNDISNRYPELKDALKSAALKDTVMDGEIVAFEGALTSFSELQKRMQLQDTAKIKASNIKVFLYLFDMIYYGQYDLTKVPLRERKKILKKSMAWKTPIKFTGHKNEHGKAFLKGACKKGWEGLIAKKGNSTYTHSRSKNWLKFKCVHEQELVIGGYTQPQGQRIGFGALLVGYYNNGKLYYAGKVGTGFDEEFLEKWIHKFQKISISKSPFKNFTDDKSGNNHWIEPKYVGQIGFTEWTKTNKLRHPRFLGMRDDKNAKEVIKEVPE